MNLIKKRGRNKKHINLAVVVGKKKHKKIRHKTYTFMSNSFYLL